MSSDHKEPRHPPRQTALATDVALAVHNQILHQIAAEAPITETLEAICRLLDGQPDRPLVSVHLANPTGTYLQAQPRRATAAIDAALGDSVPISPRAPWLGLAAYRREPVIIADTAVHAAGPEHRALWSAHDIAACWSFPIVARSDETGIRAGTTLATLTLYRRSPGEPDAHSTAAVEIAIDLTRLAIENHRRREANREIDARHRLLFDHASDAMFLLDATGTVLDVNRQACALLHAPRERLIGSALSDYDVGQDPELLGDQIARLERGELVAFETTLQHDAGGTVPVQVRSAAFFTRERRYTVSLVRDLTSDRAAHQALREQAALLRRAQEVADLSSWTYSLVDNAWGIGNDTTTLFGTPASQGANDFESLLPMVHEADRTSLQQAWLRAQQGQRLDVTFRIRRGNELHWLHAVAAVHKDMPTHLVGATRDVTVRRQLEAQVAQAQKMEALGLMAGGIAHDFNSLLTVVLGQSDVLLTNLSNDHALYPALRSIVAAGETAARLVNQLIAFSRQDYGERHAIDLGQTISTMRELIGHVLGPKVELRTDLAPLEPVQADPSQVERMFLNLAANAREAMPDGGTLSIAAAMVSVDGERAKALRIATGDYVQVSITDGGRTMCEESRARVFEPFFTAQDRHQDSGLRLATVFNIVTQAGGAITADPTEHGARFTILLPKAGREVPVTVPRTAPKSASRAQVGETVLVVEDTADVRRIARLALEQRGFQVLVAASGNDALRVAAAHPGHIDVLLTDVVMPDLHGREVSERLRARRPGLKVLYMSGYCEDALLRRGIDQTTHAFLQKPFTPYELVQQIRALLDGKPATESR